MLMQETRKNKRRPESTRHTARTGGDTAVSDQAGGSRLGGSAHGRAGERAAPRDATLAVAGERSGGRGLGAPCWPGETRSQNTSDVRR